MSDPSPSAAPPSPTRGRGVAALVLLNVALLAGIATLAWQPTPADAQSRGSGTQGQYTMISGLLDGRNDEEVLYLIDQKSTAVLPMLYDSARDRITIFGGTRLKNDLPRR